MRQILSCDSIASAVGVIGSRRHLLVSFAAAGLSLWLAAFIAGVSLVVKTLQTALEMQPRDMQETALTPGYTPFAVCTCPLPALPC